MKQFKEFRSEQTHINEIGPVGATIAGAMGLLGLGIGGYKLYKKAKEKIKSRRDDREEKGENQEAGVFVDVKVFDPETGTETTETRPLHEPGSKGASMNNDEVSKAEKEEQKKQTLKNKKAKFKFVQAQKDNKDALEKGKVLKYDKETGEYSVEDPPKDDETGTDDTQTEPKDTQTEPKDTEKKPDPEQELRKRGDAGEIDNDGDANAYYKIVGKAPTGWETKKSKTGKSFTLVKKDDAKPQGKVTGKDTSAADKLLRRNSRVLKFGEFIAEDIMKDLKKISKSKKDSEISLDDGSDIPIDPLTSEILVKYIEGLSSSEKNRTIKQIQRTERAFMKVLGKAHEG